jgi:hypothetical protein
MKRGNITKRGKQSCLPKFDGPRGADCKRWPRYVTVKMRGGRELASVPTVFKQGQEMKRRRGSIIKRGKSYLIKFDLTSENGERRYFTKTVRGTKQEAEDELARLFVARADGTLPAPTAVTVDQYLTAWLDTATGRSPKTLERYRELARRQIAPHLGDKTLQKLAPEMIRHWHVALIKKGLAPRTVHHAHRLLRQVLATAVKDAPATWRTYTARPRPDARRSKS